MLIISNLIHSFVSIYTIFLSIYCLLSWFPNSHQSCFRKFLSKVCDPYLNLFDHLNLSFGPIKFNTIFAIIVLNLSSKFLIMILGLLF